MDDERERGRQAAAATAEAATAAVADAPATTAGRVKASPLARRLAREKGIDIAQLQGSGPGGPDRRRGRRARCRRAADGRAWPRRAAAAGEVEEIALTSTRKTIARRLTEAWQAPVFQLTVSVDMTRALELRERLVARLKEGETKPTVSDLLTKVCAAALVRHPAVNAHFTGDKILRFPYAHVGIAVAAPNGLVVPVIRDADRKTIQEIAADRAEHRRTRARRQAAAASISQDGTFTISNLGMFGIEQFIAVLNPPQAAILAVGSTEEKPVVRGRSGRGAPADEHHDHVRPPGGRRRGRRGVPAHGERAARRARARAVSMATVWYRVRDLDGSAAFYRDTLGFEEVFVDFDDELVAAEARRHGDRARTGRAGRVGRRRPHRRLRT